MTIQIPEGFIPVDQAVPSHDRPVLAIRRSGYVSANFEILTARFMPDYRPLSPWRDISNDSVHDSGGEILGWREADDWLQAA